MAANGSVEWECRTPVEMNMVFYSVDGQGENGLRDKLPINTEAAISEALFPPISSAYNNFLYLYVHNVVETVSNDDHQRTGS